MNTIGRYQLVEKLGQGGMGVVYRAFDPLLQRVVALKLIGSGIESNSELKERFFREARAAGQLSHKNIITIYDLGEHEGQPYLAMEFLEGLDLQQRMAGQGKMSLSRKLELAIEVCEAIEYAHVNGLIHRDIKPANIFITNSGTAKILDFGLARTLTSELTNSNMMMGTLNYMAPEQVRGERADHRSDIFSTGVVLYELLGGRKAFQGDSFAATLYKILQEVPEPLPNLDTSIPPELVAIVERAIQKGRDERYQHMSEMLQDLYAYRQHLMLVNSPAFGRPSSDVNRAVLPPDAPTIAAPATPAGALTPPAALTPPPVTPAPSQVPVVSADSRPVWKQPAVILVGAVAVAGVGIFAAWTLTRDREPQVPAASTTQGPTEPAAPGPANTGGAADQRTRQELITRNLASARSLLEAGRFDDSARAAGEVLAVDPGNADAMRLIDEGATRSRGKGAEEARARMMRAKNAATAAAAPALAARAFNAAVSAERDAGALLRQGRTVDAMSKFSEASGLFRSAEIAAHAEAAARTERARVAQAERKPADASPQPAAPPPAPPPTVSATPLTLPPAAAPSIPAPPPAPKPGPPPQTAAPEAPAASPTSGIPELLDRYESALESRSIESLKRLWPGLGGAQQSAIRDEFANASQISVDILSPQIAVQGNNATVRFIRRYRIDTVDRQHLERESRTTMQLQRSGGSWIIEGIRFEPVR